MLDTSEIKFPKFRENRDDYMQSQREWLQVSNAALQPIHQAGWEDWLRDPLKLIKAFLVERRPPAEIERLCEILTYGSVGPKQD
jgi:hypothetical protein